jgi:hypothetical protein
VSTWVGVLVLGGPGVLVDAEGIAVRASVAGQAVIGSAVFAEVHSDVALAGAAQRQA